MNTARSTGLSDIFKDTEMMGFQNILAATALAATVALGGAAQAATNLVQNGDFSTPNQGSSWSGVPNASDGTGWQGSAGAYEVGYSHIYGLPCISMGCQNAEVNYTGFDTLSQQISGLTAGGTYNLSFQFGVRNAGGAQKMDVLFTSSDVEATPILLGTLSSVGSTDNYGWTLESYGFVSPTTSGTLSFKSYDVGGQASFGNELTNVVLAAAVPEPATWALMLVGFGGLGAALRMRRRPGLVSA